VILNAKSAVLGEMGQLANHFHSGTTMKKMVVVEDTVNEIALNRVFESRKMQFVFFSIITSTAGHFVVCH